MEDMKYFKKITILGESERECNIKNDENIY